MLALNNSHSRYSLYISHFVYIPYFVLIFEPQSNICCIYLKKMNSYHGSLKGKYKVQLLFFLLFSHQWILHLWAWSLQNKSWISFTHSYPDFIFPFPRSPLSFVQIDIGFTTIDNHEDTTKNGDSEDISLENWSYMSLMPRVKVYMNHKKSIFMGKLWGNCWFWLASDVL